jgi:hypothetical protein
MKPATFIVLFGVAVLVGCGSRSEKLLVGEWKTSRMLTNSSAPYSQELYAGFVAEGITAKFSSDGKCIYQMNPQMDPMTHTWRIAISNGHERLELDPRTGFTETFLLTIIDHDTLQFADAEWKRVHPAKP